MVKKTIKGKLRLTVSVLLVLMLVLGMSTTAFATEKPTAANMEEFTGSVIVGDVFVPNFNMAVILKLATEYAKAHPNDTDPVPVYFVRVDKTSDSGMYNLMEKFAVTATEGARIVSYNAADEVTFLNDMANKFTGITKVYNENANEGAGATEQFASTTPATAAATVAKTEAIQTSVNFTLTNPPSGTWNVYETATATATSAAISVSVSGNTLTLSHTSDVPAGTYYVSVLESGKAESARLALTVTAYQDPADTVSKTPTVDVATATKEAETQKSVTFTLTNNPVPNGEWKVYSWSAPTVPLTDVTATVTGSTLTLSSTGADLASATYNVTVTEQGKTESEKLALTVYAYSDNDPGTGGGTPVLPTFGSTTATKDSTDAKEVQFSISGNAITGDYRVYDSESALYPSETVSVRYQSAAGTGIFFLSGIGDDPIPAGTYYVCKVSDDYLTESIRVALTVNDPQ